MSVVSLMIEEVDRLFNDMDHVHQPRKRRAVEVSMSCDVSEDDERLVVEAELPGVPKEKISVSLEKDILTLEAEKEERVLSEATGQRHVREIRHGRMKRSLRLPSDVQADSSRCTFENGLLRVELKKSARSNMRKLEIQ